MNKKIKAAKDSLCYVTNQKEYVAVLEKISKLEMMEVSDTLDQFSSIRDQFAMSALQGLLANGARFTADDEQGLLAALCYQYADEMLTIKRKLDEEA